MAVCSDPSCLCCCYFTINFKEGTEFSQYPIKDTFI